MKKVYKTILIGAVIMGGGIMVIELLNIEHYKGKLA